MELKPFPLVLPDGCTHAPLLVSDQQLYSEITHQPLPNQFHHVPPIVYEKISQHPTVLKNSVQTSHISDKDIDFMILWNGFVNEFPSVISPGQTFDAIIVFIQTFRSLLQREELSYHLLSLAHINRLSSHQIMLSLDEFDAPTAPIKLWPQSVIQVMNEKNINQHLNNDK